MWRKRTYSNSVAFGKGKRKKRDKRSGSAHPTPSTMLEENASHRSESVARLDDMPNTTNNVLDPTAESTGKARDCNSTQDAILNQELERFGSDDWNWLKTNDATIREQRRFAGENGAPRIGSSSESHNVTTSSTEQPTKFEQTYQEAKVHPQASRLNEEVAKKEHDRLRPSRWARERTDPNSLEKAAGNDIDAFFELYASQQTDDEIDVDQLRFEQELANERQSARANGAPDDIDEAVEEEPDDWFDRGEKDSFDGTLSFEWHELSFDADEFEEVPDHTDWSREVRTDARVSRKQRALQEATQLGQEHAWDERGVELLAEVFERYFWSSAKASMRRELEKGMTPEELEVALDLRDFWRGRTEFSIDLGYRRSDARLGADTSRAIYHVLSWPAALRLVRMANSISDKVEIEVFLDDLYREWYSSNSLRRHYPSFRVYLYRWLEYIETRSDLVGTWCAGIDGKEEADWNEDYEYESAWLTHHRHELAGEGLLPTGGDEAYVEMMSRAERDMLGEVLAERSEMCP